MVEPQVIFKEAYDPDFGPFVSVSRLLLEGGDKNLLHLRLINRGSRIVTALRIKVCRIDESGSIMLCREYEFSGLEKKPGEEFALPGIRLPATWKKVRVEPLSAKAGDRSYDFRNGNFEEFCPSFFPRQKNHAEKTRSPFKRCALLLGFLIILLASAWGFFCLNALLNQEKGEGETAASDIFLTGALNQEKKEGETAS